METVAQQPLRVAVYQPGSAPALARQLGAGVRVRLVHHPREVRASDDLVVVIAGAGTFERDLARELGPLAPPVLVVVRRGDDDRVPAGRASGYLVVDRLDGLTAGLMSFAVLATSRRVPQPAPVTSRRVPQPAPVTSRRVPQPASVTSGRVPQPAPVTSRRVPAAAAPVPAEPLTPRERDIMALLAAGCSIREIAENLAIAGKTVRNYLSNIYRKLGARRQAEALVRWLSTAEPQAA